jgi:hypothetical protein
VARIALDCDASAADIVAGSPINPTNFWPKRFGGLARRLSQSKFAPRCEWLRHWALPQSRK